MAAGQIRVIGTQQHLKSRFGVGYRLYISHPPTKQDELDKLIWDLDELDKLIWGLVPDCSLKSREDIPGSRDQQSVYQLPLRTPIAALMQALITERDRETDTMIRQYDLAFSSLEEVFLRVAHRVEPPDNDIEYSFE
ncbi:ABC transporter A, ABCA [Kipferlia bialata]|uniref:ABC transporter A, ABCA n=1 Tax=Kipferlia bialata TaxID=797122 RepID=A0A9K3CWT7_9EUKA|nr:ABC transporter A, ABCA [Kipferlia bialata]|eukprot:g6165.t1